MSTFDLPLPTKGQLKGAALALLVLGLLLAAGSYYLGRGAAVDSTPLRQSIARARAQAEHQRQADSAAAFTAGRLYQQRLDAQTLRKQDETHDKSRPAAGPMELPDLFPAR